MQWRWGGLMALAAAAAVQVGCLWLGISRVEEQPAVVATVEETQAPTGFVLRVNAGMDEQYTDKSGDTWLPDQEYAEGKKYGFVPREGGGTVDRGANVNIADTEDPRIYQTERWLMEKFVAIVPNGKYTVILHFAETYPDIDYDGPRVFDVSIQGQPVLTDFDVSKTVGGVQKALAKTFKGIDVADGKLEIGFVQKQQNPEINGIEILSE